MTNFNDLVATLWSLALTQAKAFASRWDMSFPRTMTRAAYAATKREIEAIEALLRRALYADALRRMVSLAREPEPQAKPRKTAAAPKTTKDAKEPEPSEVSEDVEDEDDDEDREPVFRLDEPKSQGSRPFHRPRILSFDEIIAMPKREPKVRKDRLSTRSLERRFEAFMIVLHDRTATVDRLARRLLKNQPPHFKPIKTGPRAQIGADFIMEAQAAYPGLLDKMHALIAARAAPNTS
ncbi:MAG: hypothetical protein RL291_1559 [Pseudomonadota bacterium]|jgi:hypothetical protein